MIFLPAMIMMAMACGNESGNDSTDSGIAAPEETAAEIAGKIDPVCEMVYEEAWTAYTVHGADTVWFCSDYCQTAFAANPGKYGYN